MVINEDVLQRTILIYFSHPGCESDVQWETVEARVRKEVGLLVEDDINRIIDQEGLPQLRAPWTIDEDPKTARVHAQVTARLLRKYCQVRQEHIRDSQP